MACPEVNCDNSAASVTVSNASGTWTFKEFIDEGDLVDLGDTEHVFSKQRSNTGNKTRSSGNNYITMPATLNLFPCEDTFKSFFKAYAKSPLDFLCNRLVINRPCCDTVILEEAEVDSASLSNITNDTAQSTLSFTNGRVVY